jgi:hypothetical protein
MILSANGAGFAVIIFMILVLSVVPYIFFLLTLQNTVRLVNPVNRHMKPEQVWLMFIPVFNFLWVFWMIAGVADSVEDELRARGMPAPLNRPGYSVGLGYAICLCVSFVLRLIPYMNVIGIFAGFVGFVLWIIYWVQIYNWQNVLKNYSTNYIAMQDPELEKKQGFNSTYQQPYQQPYAQSYAGGYVQQQQMPPQQHADPNAGQWWVSPNFYNNQQQPPAQDQPPPAGDDDISRWMPPGHQDPPAQ